MTTIDPQQRLAAAMQTQLSALREQARLRAGALKPAAAAPGDTAGAAHAAAAQRIQAIAADDPDRRQKAVRIFLEGQLSREFGDAVLNDPAFPRLLDDVQAQMQADAQAAAAVHALGDHLLAAAARP
jgi:hypothetical protein